MKKNLYFILLLLFVSCDQKQKTKKKEIGPVKKESKYKRVLSKYEEKSFDTLRVFSPEDLNGEYKGVELDSADAVLFPKNISQLHFGDPPGLFAIYKFDIDNNTLGLITRTPSEYVPSSIKLFFFDKKKDKITSFVELAEILGDAGDLWIKDAWLYKNKQNNLESFIMIQEMHYNSVEEENDTTIQRQNYYFLLNLSKGGDTISIADNMLNIKFRNLIEKAWRKE